jgi:hAT family C-terminal dimerisation region
MALNYLLIQATSVPCKRAFSSSAETDTKKRNRIKYDFIEALQILKSRFKKEQLNFTADLLTTPKDLTGVSPDIVAKDPLAECLKGEEHKATNDANAQ